MKKFVYAGFVFCFLVMGALRGNAQVVYGTYTNPTTGGTTMVVIDLATCTACKVLEFPVPNFLDISILPNGSIVANVSFGITIYAPPYNNPVPVSMSPPSATLGSYWFNGLLYIWAYNGLHHYNPVTNQTTYLGPWPPGMPNHSGEFFEFNGQLFGVLEGPFGQVWQLDLTNPANSVLVDTINVNGVLVSVTSVNNEVFFTVPNWIYTYDPINNTTSPVCELGPMGITQSLNTLTYLPAGVPEFPCICETNAGTLVGGAVEICLPNDAVVPFNNNAFLEPDDVLQYILFSNPADTLGSILVVSNSPNISFDPTTMQTGVSYYLATIAGDGINGNVDLADDCLSISNASQVVWRPKPSVTFAVANPDVCTGNCVSITVALTGTPPFILTYDSPVGGQQTQTFAANTGMLQVCPPAGMPPGTITLSALSLSDASCVCEP